MSQRVVSVSGRMSGKTREKGKVNIHALLVG